MTDIVGTLKSSAGALLDGKLTVKLSRGLINDATTPDSWHLPVIEEFVIVDGDVDITLLESESQQIPYIFEFFEKIGETDDDPAEPIYEDFPLFSFSSIIPNVGTAQFTSLTPTGISNANLDTGAFTVARYLANDPNLILLIRPDYVGTAEFLGDEVGVKKFINKPFTEGVFIKSLFVIAPSGYDDWTFRVGYIDASGVDQTATLDSTVKDEEVGGRRYIELLYNVSLPALIKGFYVEAVDGVGATALTAYASVTYQRTV